MRWARRMAATRLKTMSITRRRYLIRRTRRHGEPRLLSSRNPDIVVLDALRSQVPTCFAHSQRTSLVGLT